VQKKILIDLDGVMKAIKKVDAERAMVATVTLGSPVNDLSDNSDREPKVFNGEVVIVKNENGKRAKIEVNVDPSSSSSEEPTDGDAVKVEKKSVTKGDGADVKTLEKTLIEEHLVEELDACRIFLEERKVHLDLDPPKKDSGSGDGGPEGSEGADKKDSPDASANAAAGNASPDMRCHTVSIMMANDDLPFELIWPMVKEDITT